MAKPSPESPIFESQAERTTREPIQYFATQETDPQTGESYEQKWASVVGVELPVYDHEREGGEGTRFDESEFKDFLVDDKSRSMLKRLAKAVKLGHSPLIEGETDIGKTKAIEYLSLLTNHKLVRISVKGTTDPSEFFGKHVPESMSVQQKINDRLKRRPEVSQAIRQRLEKAVAEQRSLKFEDYEALAEIPVDEYKGLSAPTRNLFRKASMEGRGLTKEEWMQLASLEGIDIGEKPFVWQDGEIVKAMVENNGKGYWAYIDEVGAAEPQILIALNRVLEGKHRIELSEDGGRLVDAGDEFRLFGSTNPPEYAGRLPLAKDFLRRWTYSKEGALDEKTLRERFNFALRDVELEPEIKELFSGVLTSHHLAARESISTITAKQKQKFSYEFSDLLRVRDELKAFGYDQPVEALRDAMDDQYFAKIGDDEQRTSQREQFETLLTTQNIEEKVNKILEERRPELAVSRLQEAQKQFGEELAALEARLASED